MKGYLFIYLILTCPEPLCVQFPTYPIHEEASRPVLNHEGARSPTHQTASHRDLPVCPRCDPFDDDTDACLHDGHSGSDGYESMDEELRPHDVDFEDQGRSRPCSPEGYPWPLSLAAETADPATLKRLVEKAVVPFPVLEPPFENI